MYSYYAGDNERNDYKEINGGEEKKKLMILVFIVLHLQTSIIKL